MSRVNEALKRAAAGPRLAGTPRPVAERPVDRLDPVALDEYPCETPEVSLQAPAEAQRAPAAVASDRLATVAPERDVDWAVSTRFGDAYRRNLIIDGAVSPASVEQYRRLAASVDHLQTEHGLRRLLVSSALPKEGKTLTIVNLALTLSESYERRVLLIDTDLRRPAIHDVFGIPNQYGLCEALQSERADIQLSRVSPRLWVLPAGAAKGDPMSTLASRNMEGLLDELGSSFDWVLLDAPPLGPMADAALLARLTRAVIIVIAAGSTPHPLVEKMVAEIGREQIVGVVLNRVEERNAAAWSDYYGDEAENSRP
jgi:capsular exopolysaccharide synthesis family protein